MVTSGKSSVRSNRLAIQIAPFELTPDKSRLPFPKHLTDRIEWLAHEKADTDAWLLAIDEGRFRLLSTEEVAANAHLDTLRQLVVEGKLEARNEPTFVLPPENASMPAVSDAGFAEDALLGLENVDARCVKLFLPQYYSPDDWSMILSVEGFWEIWNTRTLRKALSVPLPLGKAAIAAMR